MKELTEKYIGFVEALSQDQLVNIFFGEKVICLNDWYSFLLCDGSCEYPWDRVDGELVASLGGCFYFGDFASGPGYLTTEQDIEDIDAIRFRYGHDESKLLTDQDKQACAAVTKRLLLMAPEMDVEIALDSLTDAAAMAA